jgi:regulator of PEP synthase PpsR (kinase-PPPase family)
MEPSTSTIYVVSDAAGETGESVVKAAAIQFDPERVDIRRISYIKDTEGIDYVIRAAANSHGIIIFTIVIPELRDYLMEKALYHNVIAVDLLGPIIQLLENELNEKPRRQPGMLHQLNEDYFKRVEAIEFAVKYDDARDYSGIQKADLVLVGVSRTSKTPLSMYLAHKKLKVANVPLIPEVKPPDELFKVPKHKVVGLRISSGKLIEIRKERLLTLGLAADALYAQIERIQKELEHAESVMARIGCVVIDVSNKAVEETASMIEEMLRPNEHPFSIG